MKSKNANSSSYLENVAKIAHSLERLGFQPVLIGGMALTILGSMRMTYDFDFVIAKCREELKSLLDVFYDNGFELISRLTPQGDVAATIDNRRVAAIRLNLDEPESVYFFNPKIELRIDLLFDFPIPAKELVASAKKIKIVSQTVRIASEKHLLRLKEIAQAARHKPGDADDIAFLKSRQKASK